MSFLLLSASATGEKEEQGKEENAATFVGSCFPVRVWPGGARMPSPRFLRHVRPLL